MDAERRVLRAAHLAVFVALAELVRRRSVLQLCGASEKLGGVVFVLQRRVSVSDGLQAPGHVEVPCTHLENDVIDTLLVQERQLVQTLSLRRVDLVGELCRPSKPLDAVALALGEADFAVQLGETEAVHRSDVRQNCGATTSARR